MDVKAGGSAWDRGHGLLPLFGELRPAKRSTTPGGEHDSIRSGLCVGGEVLVECLHDHPGDRDDVLASLGFRVPNHAPAPAISWAAARTRTVL